MNGGPQFTFSPALSLFVSCESQAVVDDLWTKLLAGGGKPTACGWLEQVRAARPTLDYDGIYANPEGAPGNAATAFRQTWTGAMFLEALYRDLSRKPAGTR